MKPKQSEKPQNAKNNKFKKDKLEDKLKAKLKKKLQQKSSGTQRISTSSECEIINEPAITKSSTIPTTPNKKVKSSSDKTNKSEKKFVDSIDRKNDVKSIHINKKVKHTKSENNGNLSTKLQANPSKAAKKKSKKKRNNLPEVKKRQSNDVPNPVPKRMKTVNGFVEIDANDKEGIKLVEKKLKKEKSKIEKSSEKIGAKPEEKGPPVIVHNVVETAINSETNSDSEDDDYIEKFFDGSDNEFDENRVYSIDEIESKKKKGFLSMASEVGQSSDETATSDESTSDESANKILMRSPKDKVANNRTTHYIDDDGSIISLGSEIESFSDEINYGSSFESDSNGSNSDISFISVDDDDLSENYDDSDGDYDQNDDDESNGDSDDQNSDESNSDDYEYEQSSEDESEYEHSNDSDDTFDDFLNGRNQHSDDDHEYTDKAYDDVRIPQGTAITYAMTDNRIKIFKNDDKSKIIELPKSDLEDDECPTLAPIGITYKEFERSEKLKIQSEKSRIVAMKLKQENLQLEYEKRVKEYYEMDNLKKSHPANYLSIGTTIPVVIEVPKDSNGNDCLLSNWTSDDEKQEKSTEIKFPRINVTQCVITTMKDDPITSNERMECETEYFESNQIESSYIESPVEESSPNVTLSKAAQISRVKPKFFNSINSRHVLLLLRNILYFHGNLRVTLIAGKAKVFGYELQPNKTVTVYSPKSHSLIFLLPKPSPSVKLDACLDALKNEFYQQDINFVQNEFDASTDAIILLERDRSNKGVNMIERYMRETMFPNINAFNSDSPHYSSEFVLHCKFSYRPKNGLTLNDQWSALNLKCDSKLVTIGGKGVGKSTFVRYAINSNFTKFQKFLFIDLDIGQPELFVPQTLSVTVLTEPILGPGYLKNIKPAKAVLFGDINILPDPIKYLRCVMEISKYCTSYDEYRNIPWIINTMGYSRGFGNELMACILKIFQPTDLVQIQSHSTLDNFDRIIDADFANQFKFIVFEEEMQNIRKHCNYKTHIFNAIYNDVNGNKKQLDLTAKDLRYTMILSNLGQCLKCNSEWLTSVKPFEVSLDDLEIIVCSGDEVCASLLFELLNGNLVYLCRKNQNVNIVDCFGIGIVRSIDEITKKLYLLSTIPLTELSNVNALAIGAIPLPSAVFLNQHSQVRGSVPYVYNTDNFVGSKQVAHHIFRSEGNRKNKQIELMED